MPGLLKPFADPFLALAALIGVGGVDEVAAEVVECIEEIECSFFSALAEYFLPVVA